ncbi:hypothetical protein TELCIR_00549 [Teladorsagia circumcincta]|uniref:Protein kinase domain-containing protein n=1 Tax=Teladorsagia circumcincta TaxID=45464 RepID=A0A2G9V4D5_TELCI|nr:hypothetical protein TELCIR_00549 [Teladorsagia circumcincta]
MEGRNAERTPKSARRGEAKGNMLQVAKDDNHRSQKWSQFEYCGKRRFEQGKWSLGALAKKKSCPKFNTVVELIEYYQKHDLPGHLKMTKPIHRPKWLIKHAACTFDMQKDLVGSGNFCKVYKGLYEREENDVIQVAIKICHGASIDTMTEEAKKARESMMHEAHLMSYYVHKHVIQLYGVACDHYPVMIVMEFCPGGNLQDHLQKYNSQIEVGELICYASEASWRFQAEIEPTYNEDN